ncbi:hypothetical protein [Paenibacillus pectinilyticus]|uniref:hypothetical protein n=1 Tax=Paenibacillus pectinilyticus TaxID=512399 RepID=UPI000B0E2280|nr:hypothetical protein [Paenibacillus pectinilyticus]
MFDPAIIQREMSIIKYDLHCTAVRISGQDIERLTLAAEFALQVGLEVWLSPAYIDATEEETLTYFIQCAKAAEVLRLQFPHILFVVGCELSFFMKGLIDGATSFDRIQTMMKPWRLLFSTVKRGSFHKRLNAFLGRATSAVRAHFHGQLTYASGSWENVNWDHFDIIGIDYYREKFNKRFYREKLRKYMSHDKPVVVTEFGSCTYQGAADKGGYGWAIVDRSATPPQLKSAVIRDEEEQVTYMRELFDIFAEEKVDGAFWFTFVMATYPHDDNPLYNLDTASYSVVQSYSNQNGKTYPDMPWEPKKSFYALAEYYGKSFP